MALVLKGYLLSVFITRLLPDPMTPADRRETPEEKNAKAEKKAPVEKSRRNESATYIALYRLMEALDRYNGSVRVGALKPETLKLQTVQIEDICISTGYQVQDPRKFVQSSLRPRKSVLFQHS